MQILIWNINLLLILSHLHTIRTHSQQDKCLPCTKAIYEKCDCINFYQKNGEFFSSIPLYLTGNAIMLPDLPSDNKSFIYSSFYIFRQPMVEINFKQFQLSFPDDNEEINNCSTSEIRIFDTSLIEHTYSFCGNSSSELNKKHDWFTTSNYLIIQYIVNVRRLINRSNYRIFFKANFKSIEPPKNNYFDCSALYQNGGTENLILPGSRYVRNLIGSWKKVTQSPHISCTHRFISAKKNQRIRLILKGIINLNRSQSLIIRDGRTVLHPVLFNLSQYYSLIPKRQFTTLSISITSSSNSLLMIFYSKNVNENIRLTYEFIDSLNTKGKCNIVIRSKEIFDSRNDTKLSDTDLVRRKGFIQSPNYPNSYPNGVVCSYEFVGETYERVKFKIHDLDLFTGRVEKNEDENKRLKISNYGNNLDMFHLLSHLLLNDTSIDLGEKEKTIETDDNFFSYFRHELLLVINQFRNPKRKISSVKIEKKFRNILLQSDRTVSSDHCNIQLMDYILLQSEMNGILDGDDPDLLLCSLKHSLTETSYKEMIQSYVKRLSILDRDHWTTRMKNNRIIVAKNNGTIRNTKKSSTTYRQRKNLKRSIETYQTLLHSEMNDINNLIFQTVSHPVQRFISSTPEVFLKFFGYRSSPKQRGFKIEYEFVENYGVHTNGRLLYQFARRQTANGITQKSCVFIFTYINHPKGYLTSPNYPQRYARNTKCTYVFKGQNEQLLHITFHTFNVSGKFPCIYGDYIKISGYFSDDKKFKSYCNGRPPRMHQTLEFDGSFFILEFISDQYSNANGFLLEYEFITHRHPHTVTLSTCSQFKKKEIYFLLLLVNHLVFIYSSFII
ncbi:hypothetical protein SNEBB_007074 [Seison nebaliae]|nr:hypothetical protein SNEBB_007074 [Seison nebaliae]